MKVPILFILFYYLLHNSSALYCHQYLEKCVLNNPLNKNITIEQEIYTLYNKSENIKHIVIENFQINNLSEIICDTFENLLTLKILNSSINVISDSALIQCTKLIHFEINNNFINSLPNNLFAINNEIKIVSIKFTNITQIQGYLFKNLNLHGLIITNNPIEYIDFKNFPVMTNMAHLYIFSNKLKNINIQTIIEKFPNLKSISLDNNQLYCTKLKYIYNFLELKKIKKNHLINSLTCIPDDLIIDKIFDLEDYIKTIEKNITNLMNRFYIFNNEMTNYIFLLNNLNLFYFIIIILLIFFIFLYLICKEK